jgi:hypothetical protein
MILLAIAPAQAQDSPTLSPTPSEATSILQLSDPIDPNPANSLEQITSVSQLRDVQPTDWAYEALKSLVERYGCIVPYPDQTFRGNQPLNRWEFAAGLNACIKTLERLLQENTGVQRQDVDKLNQLVKEFSTELTAIGTRVEKLESRTTDLENHQFSTTVKLTGQAIFAFTGAFQGSTQGSIPVLQDRVRLVLESSFTGKDLLTIRLAAGNAQRLQFPGFSSNAEGNQTFNLPPGNNSINLDWLSYEFPINDRLYAYIPAYSGRWWDFAPVLNPVIGGGTGGQKALSIFGQFNPIYTIGGGSGIGLNYKLTSQLTFSGGYFAGDDTSSNPTPGNGLFNGEYSALGQVAWLPNDKFGIGFTYVNGYQPNGPIFDFGTGGAKLGTSPGNVPFSGKALTNSYGTSAFYRFNPSFVVNGFFGYTNAQNIQASGSADIWYYGLGLGFPDLGKKGNLGGIVVGAEPYRGNTSPNNLSLHLEAFYKYQFTDNISITPGIIWITSPNQSAANTDGIIGTLRTTFAF